VTDIAVGKRLRSSVCDTEIIVVRAPARPLEVQCGGHPMTSDGARRGSPRVAATGGALLGKRYVDESTGLEVLCAKAGVGALAVDGRVLTIKAPKALPASD
jgi:hypothetical protein